METTAITKMQQTVALGTDWHNDSNDHAELQHAVEEGALGATANPVITLNSLKNHPDIWYPVMDEIIAADPTGNEDDIAWALMERISKRGAEVLKPVFARTNGQKGKLSMQVHPKNYRNTDRMVEQGRHFASLVPNLAVKCPTLPAGIAAMERLTAHGITINATVCYSVAQAVEAAEAVERGAAQAGRNGVSLASHTPYVTIMMGRLDDHLKRVREAQNIDIDPELINWASVAVFKRAYQIFCDRGYRSKLLSAALRGPWHWSELVGGDVVVSMTHKYWTQFNDSGIEVRKRIHDPVDLTTVDILSQKFADFRRAYKEDGMRPDEFESYGATQHTMEVFLGGYDEYVKLVRMRMIKGRNSSAS